MKQHFLPSITCTRVPPPLLAAQRNLYLFIGLVGQKKQYSLRQSKNTTDLGNRSNTLAECFADINSEQVRIAMQKHYEQQDKLRPCVKTALEDNNLLQRVFEAYSNRKHA